VAGQGAACDNEVEATTDPVVHDGGTKSRRKIQAGEGEGGRERSTGRGGTTSGGRWRPVAAQSRRCEMRHDGGWRVLPM
jgi:hypothetical protein